MTQPRMTPIQRTRFRDFLENSICQMQHVSEIIFRCSPCRHFILHLLSRHLAEERLVVLVEADLVIELCGGQADQEGGRVDEDRDASRTEGQQHLELTPVQLGKVVPGIVLVKCLTHFGCTHITVFLANLSKMDIMQTTVSK